MRSVATTFAGLVEPTVFVIGVAKELDALLPSGARTVRVGAGPITHPPAPIALVVLDARNHSLSVLAEMRHSPRFAAAPALLVTDDEDDEGIAAVAADDVIEAPLVSSCRNRLRTLIELGRARFALWIAEQTLEHSASGLTIADGALPDVPLLHATSVFETLTGYSLTEVRGKNCRFLQGPETSFASRRTLGDAVRERRQAQVTILNYKKGGAPFWNQVTVFPVRTPDGEALGWLGGVQHDVTSLVDARAEVDRLSAQRQRRQEFDEAILNGVDVGIVTSDTTGRVTFINRCARDILRREDDLVGVDVQSLLRLPSPPSSILATIVERRLALSHRLADCTVEIDLSVSRASEEGPEDLGFFFIFNERTRERQLEMDRRRFERLAAMGTMVAGFAHEIRNPMASLRSIAESLKDELDDASVKLPHVDRMLTVLDRVERLVRTSLLFGRPAPPRPAAYRPWTILSAAVSSVLPRTRALGGDLCIEADPDLPDVYVDDAQIAQALIILLNNALDATGSPRRVVLRAQPARVALEPRGRKSEPPWSAFVRFDVHDDGPGIPPDIMGRIFDPFFTTKASGTGLGLSIAQQLVTENASRVELVSAVGGPTTFSVLVPVATDPPPSRPMR